MPNSKSSDIILGILAAIFFIAGLAGIYYFYQQDQQIHSETNLKQQEIKVIQDKIKGYPDLMAKLEQRQAEEAELVNFIPSREQQKEFVWELEALAEQSGVAITQCEISRDIKRLAALPQYQVYQWKINIRGSFAGLSKFLDSLPISKRAAVVSDLKIASQTPQQNEAAGKHYVLSADMTLDLLSNPAWEKVAK